MSFLEYNVKTTPSGIRKVLYLNWPLTLLLIAVAGFGFLMLYSSSRDHVSILISKSSFPLTYLHVYII